jgi:Tfp pilus assembly protein PilF
VDGFVYRAMTEIQTGQIDAAARDADWAMGLDAKSADAMYVRGAIYQRQHDTANARRLFEQALDAGSADWQWRADCLAALRAMR